MKKTTKSLFDTYSLHARIFPALISALPLLLLWYFVSCFGELSKLMSYVTSFRFLGGVTFGIIFLYLYAQTTRTVSKYLEKRYFLEGKGFPTTYLMLYSDDIFSKDYKDEYRKRATSAFGLSTPTEEEEKDNIWEAKKRLSEITKQVILDVGSGQLVLKHNIWYGFFRNLIGGSILSSLFCLLNIYIGVAVLRNPTLWASSVVLLVFYIFTLVFRKPILIQHAEAYAKQLIAEFMEKNKD